MEVRTFYADTVEAAFALAKQEFGAEAMLLESRRTAPGTSPRGEYEVVFAGEPLATPARASETAVRPYAPKVILSNRGSHIPELVRPTRVSKKEIAFGPVDLVPANAVAVVKAPVARELAPPNRRTLQIVCNAGISRFEAPSYSIALVGPTGAGKTTTAMKLAVRYGLVASRPCRLLAYDPDRVGTTERLRHFSNLLKIPFEAVETPARLSTLIGLKTDGLTIIDTPGCSRADDQILGGLAFLLGSHRDVETQLVLRADRKAADNIAAAARFAGLMPQRLIVTGIDETSDYQDLEALAVATALPFSFLGIGQRIPDDLEPARLERLEDLLSHGFSKTSAAAA